MKKYFGFIIVSLLAAGMLTGCGESITEDNSDIIEVTGTSATVITEETTTEDAGTATTAEAEGTGTDVTTEAPAQKEAAATTIAADSDAEPTAADNADPENHEASVTDAPAQQEQPQTTEPPAEEPYLLDELKIGESCADYVAAHNNCRQETAPSCIGKGEDHVYTYADYTLYSYVEDGKESLREIAITGGDFETRKGIRIGSTIAEVTAAYGEPEEPGFYSYQTEDGRLQIFFDGNNVSKLDFFINQ
ncbi:MAG: hypothetical protein MJ065_04930 [Oscillospiraceae bacterium]|nr:hypothetical protein [Oscillospiraceae bacterium]